MKKYIVLPFDEYNRNRNKITSDESNPNGSEKDPDDAMKSLDLIMNDKKRDDSEKQILYSQLLNKLISLVNEERKNQDSHRNIIITHEFRPEEKIKALFTNKFVKKGLLLLDAFDRSREVSWNDTGEIIIMGKTIRGSNIVDLINFTIRNVKTDHPIGFEVYKNWLLDSEISRDLITNPLLTPSTSSVTSIVDTSNNTPKTRKTRSKRKINLQNNFESELGQVTPIIAPSKFSPQLLTKKWKEY